MVTDDERLCYGHPGYQYSHCRLPKPSFHCTSTIHATTESSAVTSTPLSTFTPRSNNSQSSSPNHQSRTHPVQHRHCRKVSRPVSITPRFEITTESIEPKGKAILGHCTQQTPHAGPARGHQPRWPEIPIQRLSHAVPPLSHRTPLPPDIPPPALRRRARHPLQRAERHHQRHRFADISRGRQSAGGHLRQGPEGCSGADPHARQYRCGVGRVRQRPGGPLDGCRVSGFGRARETRG